MYTIQTKTHFSTGIDSIFTLVCPLKGKSTSFSKCCFSKVQLSVSDLVIFLFFKRQILDFSKLEEFQDDNFFLFFHENGRELSKRVENSEGKGEIARYKQFLIFQQCFQKNCTLLQTRKNQNLLEKCLTLSQTTNFRLFQTERVCRRQVQIF